MKVLRLILLPVLLFPWLVDGAMKAARPNMIILLTDDQGYGDLSCTGNPVLKTPNLDRLHDEGVRFNDFHVSPTCAPTRSALMSGKHEFKNGVTHTILERERMSLKTTTIAQLLQGAGYSTGIFGKWHLGDEDPYQPDRRGFEEVFIHGAGGIGQTYAGSCGDAPGNRYFDPVIKHNGKFEKTRGYCTDVFFRQALQWIDSVKGKKPFFVYLTPNAPHAPLECPPEYEKLYADRLKPAEAKFFGMIANIDDNMGKLLAKIREWNLEENTLIIFMNDNGGTQGVRIWNAGLHGAKGTPWQGGTRAASFWRWPGRLKPADVTALTAQVDLFPTLAELAGAEIPAAVGSQLDGRSLVPLLAKAQASWPDRYLVTHVGRWPQGTEPVKEGQCGIRNSRFSLVYAAKAWQLFDLKADPAEARNVAMEYPDTMRELKTAYDRWWEQVLPCLENEKAQGPKVNPFKEQYWKQYNGPGPNQVPPSEQ